MLSAADLAAFVGGDIEVQLFEGRPVGIPDIVRCGPVLEFVDAVQVVARLEWCGEMRPKTAPGRWTSNPEVAEVMLPLVMNVPEPDDIGRLIFITEAGVFTLFGPNGKKLERGKVKGL